MDRVDFPLYIFMIDDLISDVEDVERDFNKKNCHLFMKSFGLFVMRVVYFVREKFSQNFKWFFM